MKNITKIVGQNTTQNNTQSNTQSNEIENFINKKIHKHRHIYGWLSILIHVIIMAFILITPFFAQNKKLILSLIWLNAALLTEWYLLGNSVLNFSDHLIFEDENDKKYYNSYKYHTGEKASIFLITISELTGIDIKTLGQITTLIPLFLITYMLCKLS
jgi:hypothetical protein